MADFPFFRLPVRDKAGFFFLPLHPGGKVGLGLLEFLAVLIGFLVLGVLEIGVGFLFRFTAFKGGGKLCKENVVGPAVKHQVVEVSHKAQLAGSLYYIEPVERAL